VFTVDFRHPDAGILRRTGDRLVRECESWSGSCKVVVKELMHSEPVVFDPDLVALVEDCSNRREYSNMRMVSGATHDAQNLSHVCPTAMIFIPCRDGVSHHESEHAEHEHIVAGANVLLDAITRMACGRDASRAAS
jgi:N-carbamoyl-L-amino-acid hydrolase